MRSPRRHPAARVAVALVALAGTLTLASGLAACGDAAQPPSEAAASPTDDIPPAPTATGESSEPVPTPVPGGETPSAGPVATRIPTTQTNWGEILDGVPADFPVYPGAEPAESGDGPVSASWLADAAVDEVAAWYTDSLEAQGFSILDLSTPLEDGTRMLDVASDLPECRLQLAFRPLDGSTMIVALYGSGCVGVGG